MFKAYKYRIYPTEEQEVLLVKTFGCVRFVYNWALEKNRREWKENHAHLSRFDMQHLVHSELIPQNDFLKNVDSQALQYSILHLSIALDKFYKGISKCPNFRKKKALQSFTTMHRIIADVEHGYIRIPKFRKGNSIRCKFHRKFEGEPKSITILKEPDGKYYASLVVEQKDILVPKKHVSEKTTLGIDVGILSLMTLSNGKKIPNPHFFEQEDRYIKRLSRRLSKRVPGSKRYERTRIRLAKCYSKISHRRTDYINKVVHNIVCDKQVHSVAVESLNIKGMMRNHSLSKSIRDAGWGYIYEQLEYKCEQNGINYVKIGRFEPSSKTCRVCGYKTPKMDLSVRVWRCPKCGAIHDRDVNAAINIKKIGYKTLLMEREEVKPVEKPTMDDRAKHLKSRVSVKQEKSLI